MGKRSTRRRDEKTKRLSPASRPIVPRNQRQEEALSAVTENEQAFLLGAAGAGKTYIPTAYAANELATGNIQKIVLVRPAKTAGEDHGFIPGTLDEKLEPWLIPFMDVLEERMSKSGVIRAREEGKIEFAPISHMRGRTLNNAIILVDEAQNCTYDQLKLLLTRMGENSRVFVMGDHTQTDLGNKSGLPAFVKMAEGSGSVPVVRFGSKDVVRSAICQFWTEQTEKWEAAA